MARPVLLIADARSGSTWCAQILESHPAVRFYGEVFIQTLRPQELDLPHPPLPAHGSRPLTAPPLSFAQYAHQHRRPFRAWRYLSGLLAEPTPARIVGFKFMYSQCVAHPSVFLWASAHGARVIHLVRTNRLHRVMSGYVSRATSVAHTAEPVQIPTFQVDPADLISRVRAAERRVAKARAFLRALPLSTHEVSYEALRRDPDRVSRRLFHAVGLEPVEYQPRGTVQKRVDKPYEEIVSNYAEIREALDRHGIPYQF
jgi:LPS sulfotransferase NodH